MGESFSFSCHPCKVNGTPHEVKFIRDDYATAKAAAISEGWNIDSSDDGINFCPAHNPDRKADGPSPAPVAKKKGGKKRSR